MDMNLTRRAFFGGAAAWAVWPKDLFGASGKGGKQQRPPQASAWEKPDGSATDAVMVRRLYLDLAGRIPTRDEAQAYVYSADPKKRQVLADKLLASQDFADYWAMRFCDILRVKSEFPINLWPNAVYVYHARIRAFVEQNEPWDAFGRTLLTAQGSDFRDAEANFFRATDMRTPDGWAAAVAQTFLGIPPLKLKPDLRKELAAFLSNVKIKDTREWKEEIVFVEGPDRRGELCDLLFTKKRAEVAAAFSRTVRRWIYGPKAGAGKVPGEMRLKNVLREIVLSPEYARGSVTGGFPARRLDAEVLDDAICTLSGSIRDHQSPAPEPFTFLPPKRATICVEDGSITNGFLTLFGRPARDTGLPEERGSDVTAKQRLYLFNSSKLHRQLGQIAGPPGKLPDGTPNPIYQLPLPKRIDDIYWRMLAREPTPYERQLILGIWQKRGGGKKRNVRPFDLLRDVAWCLVNTKEFIFRI